MDERARHNRLKWRSRRGMRELDLLLVPFAEENLPGLSEAQQHAFERLLEFDDPELMSWFNGHDEPVDPLMVELVSQILNKARD